ncbi:hypothetical protein CB1_001982001 [Camelus ferus]|nr:hypothetical protein CB1_001982001 [Camelus ferus]
MIERRLDTVRSVCHHSHKRLMACFQGQHGTDAERRHAIIVTQLCLVGPFVCFETQPRKMLETCGDAENQLALELSQHEVFIEKEIVDPLYGIAEVDIPNIQKQRKQLAKLVLDWDSVRARWNQAHKSSGTNFQGLPSKIDTLKEEMDEAGNKVEQCKDQLAADMYNFMAKEGEYGQFFVTGLFRIGAGASKLKKLKAALDCSTSHLDEFYSDPHAVADTVTPSHQTGRDEKSAVCCDGLYLGEVYLIKFLAKLAQTSDINKMTPSNIAIVLGPNLLWAKNEGTLAEMAAATSVHVVAVIEPIIQHANWFFPEEVEFNVSEAFVPLATPNSNHSSHTGNDCDSGTLERKRPASMAVMEGDLVKKESFGVKLMDFQAPRRGGTLNRKHVSPAFQPPLPPTDGSTLAPAGPEPPPQSSRAESSTGGGTGPSSAGTLEQGPSPGDGSPPKPKDSAPAPAPAPGRSSGQAASGQNPAPAAAGSHQLSVGPAHNSAGPSPHTLRRDSNSRISEPLRSIFPEMHSDSASKDLPGRILLDMDNDTESTAL